MSTATLDTNVLLEHWKGQQKQGIVDRLLALADAGVLDLAVTARIRADVPAPPLSERINTLPVLGVGEIRSVFNLDWSVLGDEDEPDVEVLGADTFFDAADDLSAALVQAGKTAPDWRDWDHLHAHYVAGRDVFLTWDRRVLDIAQELARRFGVSITTPEEFLAALLKGTA